MSRLFVCSVGTVLSRKCHRYSSNGIRGKNTGSVCNGNLVVQNCLHTRSPVHLCSLSLQAAARSETMNELQVKRQRCTVQGGIY